MDSNSQHFIPILFKVLFGFIIFNIVVNLILLYIKRRRLYKLLALYWPIVLFVFIMQAAFQTGILRVSMAYSTTICSVTIISMIGFEAIGRRFPLKEYLLYYIPFFPLTMILAHFGYGFTTVAMPFAIAIATPLIHTFINIHFIDRTRTTRMQKLLGLVYLITGIHSINFAIFRMDPDAQLWGWLVSYAVYDMLAILLPSIALEEASISESKRLKKLVDEKTSELNSSSEQNQKLLSIMMHDISNPLTAMKFYLSRIKPMENDNEINLNKVKKNLSFVEDVLMNVRSLYKIHKTHASLSLSPILIEDCFNELSIIFAKASAEKNIELVFKNQLLPGTKVLGEKISLTHSVLSNLVNNALKFSSPNSEIEIIAKEEKGSVVIEIQDHGPGIPNEVIQSIMFNHGSISSSTGTAGEKGLGLGLSIVKSFVDSYGGQIVIESKQQVVFPQDHGTTIRIVLEKAPMLLS